jgi:hypothetical protein
VGCSEKLTQCVAAAVSPKRPEELGAGTRHHREKHRRLPSPDGLVGLLFLSCLHTLPQFHVFLSPTFGSIFAAIRKNKLIFDKKKGKEKYVL